MVTGRCLSSGGEDVMGIDWKARAEEAERRLIDRENETDELIKAEERKREEAERRLDEAQLALAKKHLEVRRFRDEVVPQVEQKRHAAESRERALREALKACVLKRRRDRPGFDPTFRDANQADETAEEYIRRADAAARAALASSPSGQGEVYRAGCAECAERKQAAEDSARFRADVAEGKRILLQRGEPASEKESR